MKNLQIISVLIYLMFLIKSQSIEEINERKELLSELAKLSPQEIEQLKEQGLLSKDLQLKNQNIQNSRQTTTTNLNQNNNINQQLQNTNQQFQNNKQQLQNNASFNPATLMVPLLQGKGIFDSPQNVQNFVLYFSEYLSFLDNLQKNQFTLNNGMVIDACTALSKMSPLYQRNENLKLCVPMNIYSNQMKTCFVWACLNNANETFFYRICSSTIPFNRKVMNLDNFGEDLRIFQKTSNPQDFTSESLFPIDKILNCNNSKDMMKNLQIVNYFGGDMSWDE